MTDEERKLRTALAELKTVASTLRAKHRQALAEVSEADGNVRRVLRQIQNLERLRLAEPEIEPEVELPDPNFFGIPMDRG